MNFYLPDFFKNFSKTSLKEFTAELESLTLRRLKDPGQGDFEKWRQAFLDLPEAAPSSLNLQADWVQVGKSADIALPADLKENLLKFHPWRKGPFELFGIQIDTEWRSYLKWNRISQVIQPLAGRVVLDLGCGNGYYLWRMLGEGASLAVGIDPSWLYFFQFHIFQKYIQKKQVTVLPLGAEDLPSRLTGFDTVFSMGLLYHRRDPKEHLSHLFRLLRRGGELVLETLIVEGGEGEVLKPSERYAKMRNVWNIPTCATLQAWLLQSGFADIRCVDVAVTTPEEQRKTEWMKFESLEDFLNPKNLNQTIEGYPAPKRAIFIAERL